MSNSLGLNISLPSGTLSQLKASRSSRNYDETSNPSTENQSGIIENNFFCDTQNGAGGAAGFSTTKGNQWGSSDDDESEAENEVHNRLGLNLGDREIMPFIPSDSCSDDDGNGDWNDEDNNYSDDDQYVQSDDQSLDNVSMSPPPTMPLLAVQLDKLCGYIPSDEHESKQLAEELCGALLGLQVDNLDVDGDREDNGESVERHEKQSGYGDGLSLDFTARAVELLEAGVAHHMDTAQQKLIFGEENDDAHKYNYAFVPYPEFIKVNSNNADGDMPSIMATAKIWKRILHPHDIAVVDKLLKLLSKCSRDLIWKHAMAMEIRRIAKEEKHWQEEKKRRREIRIWRRETRPGELAKLYEVRETFELKLSMLRTKHESYVKEREERVQKELLRRKEKGIGNGGISGLDWDSKITFAFDDDVEDIIAKMLVEKKAIEDDNKDLIDDAYFELTDNEFDNVHDDGYDCDQDDGSESDENDFCNDTNKKAQRNDSFERKNRRIKATTKRVRRKLDAEKERARVEEVRSKVKAAHDEEEHVRQMCICTDEKVAMAMVTNLEKRLEKIDNLLDSLQMDAWKDEEEGLLDSDSLDEYDEAHEINESTSSDEMTLLDSILAMILGSMYPSRFMNSQQHYTYIKDEHKSIVKEWKLTFGRIPKLNDNPLSSPKISEAIPSGDCWSDSDSTL